MSKTKDSIKKNKKGLILINTGNGKGKTTAAMGLALRAAGRGLKVLILQFIKGPWKSGEVKALEKLKPLIEVEQLGLGFIRFKNGRMIDRKKQLKSARESLEYARNKVESGKYDLVILDEINNLMGMGLLKAEDVVDLVKNKPEDLNLMLTGRNAPDELIEIADTVTEMREIKHAFNRGIKARKGIEF